MNENSAGDHESLIVNIETTAANSGRRASSLNDNLTENQIFLRSFEEIKTQMFAKNEKVFKIDRPLEIRSDGPYGTPSRHIFDSIHAILVRNWCKKNIIYL